MMELAEAVSKRFTRQELEGLWNTAAGLDDASSSPVSKAIIAEALEGSEAVINGEVVTGVYPDITAALSHLSDDVERFTDAIVSAYHVKERQYEQGDGEVTVEEMEAELHTPA